MANLMVRKTHMNLPITPGEEYQLLKVLERPYLEIIISSLCPSVKVVSSPTARRRHRYSN